MDSADVLYAATQLLFPTCNITITAESSRLRLGMYEVSKVRAWEVHSLKVIITPYSIVCALYHIFLGQVGGDRLGQGVRHGQATEYGAEGIAEAIS